MDILYDLFSFEFIQNAFLAAFLISICSGIIGSIIVASKTVFLSGGVAHSAFGGVGLALYFGFNVLIGASIISIIMSSILLYFVMYKKYNVDSFIASSWAFGMALGVILMDITPGYGIDMTSYLFGSIISVSIIDIYVIFIFDLILIIFTFLYYREILSILYDESFCKLKKMKVNLFLLLIFIFISLGIVMSMNVAGLILVLSILSIPAYISSIFVKSLKQMMFLSCILSFIFIMTGFYISYKYNLSIGACVAMSAISGMLIGSCINYLIRLNYGKRF